uniref:Uncharacterized protein n=1 Tax=viral metagenome TaxID=1070528 RepID=A0A6C0CUS8_9ZZZZ
MTTKINLCKYKNMFGEPGTGAHSYRFWNIAIVDVVLTILAGLILSWITGMTRVHSIITMFVLGIIAHRLFCVRTTVDKLLFPKG